MGNENVRHFISCIPSNIVSVCDKTRNRTESLEICSNEQVTMLKRSTERRNVGQMRSLTAGTSKYLLTNQSCMNERIDDDNDDDDDDYLLIKG